MNRGRVFSVALVGFLVLAGAASTPPEQDAKIKWAGVLLVQLQVADLDRAVAFYSETLGMEVESVNRDIQWARIKPGIRNVTIGLGVGDAAAGSGSSSVNLGVNNLDETRRILEARGVEFLGPTIEIPGVVRLADLKDPDGNTIRLAGHSPGFGG